MRIAVVGLLVLGTLAATWTGSTLAGGKEEPKASVQWARTWQGAVDEAKALNVPIVVHNHGFYCGPCWGMHASVVSNDKYIEYASENTVEVIAEQDLQKGVDEGKDKRAAMYDAKDENGNPVKYMMEWPGLTLPEMLALHASPASSYNHTGGIPYTAIIDPHTLQEISNLPGGGHSVKAVIEKLEEAKATLTKAHGPQAKRSSLRKVDAGAKAVDAALAKSGAAKAFGELAKLEALVAKEGDALKAKVTAVKSKLVEAAAAELDRAEGMIGAGDTKGAAQILNPLKSGLKGTDLEAKLKELLEKTKPASTDAK